MWSFSIKAYILSNVFMKEINLSTFSEIVADSKATVVKPLVLIMFIQARISIHFVSP